MVLPKKQIEAIKKRVRGKELKDVQMLHRAVDNVLETDEAIHRLSDNIYALGSKVQDVENRLSTLSAAQTPQVLGELQAADELLGEEEQKIQEYAGQLLELERHSRAAHRMVKAEAKTLRKEAGAIRAQIQELVDLAAARKAKPRR